MNQHSKLRTQLAVASVGISILLVAQSSSATAIGHTQIHSLQNEPLLASIDVKNIDPNDFSVSIASHSIYQQLGLDAEAPIKVEFVKKSKNSGALVLTSNKPISEPFADVVLVVNDQGLTKSVPKTLLLPLDNQIRNVKSVTDIYEPLLSFDSVIRDKFNEPLLTSHIQPSTPFFKTLDDLLKSNESDYKPLLIAKNVTPPPLFENTKFESTNSNSDYLPFLADNSNSSDRNKHSDFNNFTSNHLQKNDVNFDTKNQIANPLSSQESINFDFQPLNVLSQTPPPLFDNVTQSSSNPLLFANQSNDIDYGIDSLNQPSAFVSLFVDEPELNQAASSNTVSLNQDSEFRPLNVLAQTPPPLFDSTLIPEPNADDALMAMQSEPENGSIISESQQSSLNEDRVVTSELVANGVVSGEVIPNDINGYEPLNILANAAPPPLLDNELTDNSIDNLTTIEPKLVKPTPQSEPLPILFASKEKVESLLLAQRIVHHEEPSINANQPDSIGEILKSGSNESTPSDIVNPELTASNSNTPDLDNASTIDVLSLGNAKLSTADEMTNVPEINNSPLKAVTIKVTRQIKDSEGQLLVSQIPNNSQIDDDTVIIKSGLRSTA